MVVELTASRLIANYVGNSLYTWTSVIGVVLAGISVGNYLGGWLADRYDTRRVLAWLFLIAGFMTFGILFLNNYAATVTRPEGMSWPIWVMLVVAGVFFVPALSLGTISPVTASMALKRTERTGITLGSIYAWGALGSICGTFLTGFWLIGEFGSRQVVCMTSIVLVTMAAILAGGQRIFRVVALVGPLPLMIYYGIISSATAEGMSTTARAIAGISSGWKTTPADFAADEKALAAATKKRDETTAAAARARGEWRAARKQNEDRWAQWGGRLGAQLHALGMTLALRRDDPSQYHAESDYFSINVSTNRSGDEVVKSLSLDHLIHSYYNPQFPTKLHYEYEMIYAACTERAALLWDRETAVTLSALPWDDDFATSFPARVRYNPGAQQLSIRGPMSFAQLWTLLSIGPRGAYGRALLSAWQQSNGNKTGASKKIGGVIVVPLQELPDGVTFPARIAARVRYDRALKAIVCTAPFSDAELFALLAQGEMQQYVEAVTGLDQESRSTSALFVGGGGYIFPRWLEATFPGQPLIDVAEIDPAVQQVAERELGLPREYGHPSDGKTFIRTHVGDARNFVDERLRENERKAAKGEPPLTYDFIYGDAFNDLSVPWHLTTREYSEKIVRLLTPGLGVYLINLIDIYPRVTSPENSGADCYLSGTPPEALRPVGTLLEVWQPAPARFPGLQLFFSGQEGYRLGFRGIMSEELRDRLLKVAASDKPLQSAIRSLFQRSHQEKAGQFLARYLNTATTLFPYVYLFTSNEEGPQEGRDTFVVVCALKDLEFEMQPAISSFWKHGPFAWTQPDENGTPHDFGEMPAIRQLARGQLLTDDFAPVDNLLIPVAVNASRKREE
jgi:hypothetical protein